MGKENKMFWLVLTNRTVIWPMDVHIFCFRNPRVLCSQGKLHAHLINPNKFKHQPHNSISFSQQSTAYHSALVDFLGTVIRFKTTAHIHVLHASINMKQISNNRHNSIALTNYMSTTHAPTDQQQEKLMDSWGLTAAGFSNSSMATHVHHVINTSSSSTYILNQN